MYDVFPKVREKEIELLETNLIITNGEQTKFLALGSKKTFHIFDSHTVFVVTTLAKYHSSRHNPIWFYTETLTHTP